MSEERNIEDFFVRLLNAETNEELSKVTNELSAFLENNPERVGDLNMVFETKKDLFWDAIKATTAGLIQAKENAMPNSSGEIFQNFQDQLREIPDFKLELTFENPELDLSAQIKLKLFFKEVEVASSEEEEELIIKLQKLSEKNPYIAKNLGNFLVDNFLSQEIEDIIRAGQQ